MLHFLDPFFSGIPFIAHRHASSKTTFSPYEKPKINILLLMFYKLSKYEWSYVNVKEYLRIFQRRGFKKCLELEVFCNLLSFCKCTTFYSFSRFHVVPLVFLGGNYYFKSIYMNSQYLKLKFLYLKMILYYHIVLTQQNGLVWYVLSYYMDPLCSNIFQTIRTHNTVEDGHNICLRKAVIIENKENVLKSY